MSLRSKLSTASTWAAIDSFGVRGTRFVFGIMLARLLHPEDIGLIAMVYLFVDVPTVLANAGFQTALVQKQNPSASQESSVFYVNAAAGLLMAAVVFFISGPVADFYNAPELKPIIQVMSIIPCVSALSVIHVAVLYRKLDMKSLALANLFATLLASLVCLYMAYSGYGVWSLVVQQILWVFCYTVAMWLSSPFRPQWLFSIRSITSIAKFAFSILGAELINKGFTNIYNVVIGKFYGGELLGYYSRANTLQRFPSLSITAVVARVLFPTLSAVQTDGSKTISITSKMLGTTLFIIAPVMAGLAGVAPSLIPLLLTEKWAPSIPIFQVLCLHGALRPLLAINAELIKAQGKAGLLLRLEILNTALMCTVLLITFRHGIHVIAAGQVLSAALAFLVMSRQSARLTGFGLRRQFVDVAPFVASALIMYAAVTAAETALREFGYAATISVQAALGAAVYFCILHISGNRIFVESLTLLRTRSFKRSV